MTRSLAFSLSLLALTALAAPAGGPSRHGVASADRWAPNLELSASFLPPRFVAADTAQIAKVERFLRGGRRDSTEWFRTRRNSVTLSQGLLWRLAEEEGAGNFADSTRRARALARIERLTGVRLAESRVVGFPAEYVPNDFAKASTTPQWGLINDGSGGVTYLSGLDINIKDVWERFDGSDTLVIAVIDAGLNFSHPDLQNRWYVNPGESGMTQSGGACWTGTPKDKSTNKCDDDANGYVDDWRGWDFVDNDNDPQDFHYHGTETGGIIAARFDNDTGVAGMLPRVKILPVRVLGTSGSGYSDAIAAGVRYAAKMKAHAANFSIGINGTGTATGPDTAIYNAFVVARDSGLIIAAATGNNGLNLETNSRQPFSYGLSNVYGIAAIIESGTIAGFSNYGSTKADLAAPGVEIATTTIPPSLSLYSEDFEAFNSSKWTISTSSGNPTWVVATDSMQGTKAFKWSTGVTTTATLLDTLDMRDKRGGLLTFKLNYTPHTATFYDYLLLEYQKKSSPTWIYFAVIGTTVTNQTISLELGGLDDTLYRVRLRTCRLTGYTDTTFTCLNSGTPTGRVVRVDDLKFTYADENPANQAVYESHGGGTSLAAPFFAGYAGLMRLAADRMGVPLTRSLMLSGVTTMPALSGKVATGGRLNVAKGLDFYLKTLPRTQINDSNVSTWSSGDLVTYAFRALDTSGVSIPDFVFTPVDTPSGSMLEPEGDFSWNTAGKPLGTYTIRVKAAYGPHVLRKIHTFTVNAVVNVSSAAEARLRIGGRVFAIPAELADGRRALRVQFYGADGRTLHVMDGDLALPPDAKGEYRIQGFPSTAARAWLGGVELRAIREK